jgi:hypothetical protein
MDREGKDDIYGYERRLEGAFRVLDGSRTTERKPDVKTDERDAARIAKEDSLGYLRRVYVPDPYVEEMRQVVMRQIQVGRKIARVKKESSARAPGEEHGPRAGRRLRPLRGGGAEEDGGAGWSSPTRTRRRWPRTWRS